MFSNFVTNAPFVPKFSDFNLTGEKGKKIKGSVVLMRKNALDFNDFTSSALDTVSEFLGGGISVQLVSATNADQSANGRAKLGKPAYLENWMFSLVPLTAGDSAFGVNMEWDDQIGVPGAILVKNNHETEFFLKSVILEDVPGVGRMHFVCNSWVYPARRYKRDRIFFINKSYLPGDTPGPLQKYREEELVDLRGDGKGERKEGERIYDYDVYNDLGDPDKGKDLARPTLGGSSKYPYPRRGRTGRPPTRTDPNCESRLFLPINLDMANIMAGYAPRDEKFGHLKTSDFLAYALKSLAQVIKPALESYFGRNEDFKSFDEVLNLYEGGFPMPTALLETMRNSVPLPMLKEMFRTDGEQFLRFPVPQVIKEDRSAWRTDEEFGREMLGGVNPLIIRRLNEFPLKSKLDPKVYGDQNSKITEQHIKSNLDGLSVEEAIKNNKLFILDHHDSLMPYVRAINRNTDHKIYATRTILLLKSDGTLKPLAIELSLPHPDKDELGCTSKVYTPAAQGVQSYIWQLAKAYVAVNDSGYHQLISHWLNTHAVIEPFIIATNRQLSVLHPIHKLLQPHYRDTMNINAQARQLLISAGGMLESTCFPGKYAMEMSSVVYKNWVFPDQALPADLLKRGVAVKDESCPHGVRLLIEDYPFAVDGLQIWSAIKTWVQEYCNFYYKSDDMVQKDPELQAWWKELVQKGHGDLKDAPWWPKMQTRQELIETCTIVIWISSALHAAVNFGQYPFAGYLPNRPTVSRRFMPEEGTPEYEELKRSPDRAFFKTVNAQIQALVGVSLIEILSRHASDEVYLGRRDSPEWASDKEVLEAFRRFGNKLAEIENAIVTRNNDKNLKNRVGPVKMPYTLLYPTSEEGLTGKGIPNSISI